MKIIPGEQYGELWHAVRRGIPTASDFGKIVCAKTVYEVWIGSDTVSSHRTPETAQKAADKHNKKKPGHVVYEVLPKSEQAEDYACQLLADIYDPHYPRLDSFASAAMKNGSATEEEARNWYAMERDCDVEQVCFCTTDDGRLGCSPDGLIGDEGGLELKCPLPKTHLRWLIAGGLPEEHRQQTHGELIVTGCDWIDFMSYAPGLPPLLVRVEPDGYTKRLRPALMCFCEMFDAMREKLNLGAPPPNPIPQPIELPAMLA